ncbi:serine hydrolase domain-containing protein [Parerythrobacter jejuensis]|uniref:Serine hydrolase n=1 Tax=Parerythrobacter jejuensis TaxID=795812 RepID=A0A845AU76_9SPHN|nr:serine hydrolase domain-containing protein [Parerythrobacter jejuensis]MXP32723.1 serine hydrolase [Parerythrobacter jejuensis]
MIRTTIAVAAVLFLAASPATAQSQQEQLDSRYDRALAAGYKALFLCSALANSERNGSSRTVESIEQWELTGIQEPLNSIVPELNATIERHENGTMERVSVDWADGMPPRFAVHIETGGCSLTPIGGVRSMYGRPAAEPASRKREMAPIAAPGPRFAPLVANALSTEYGEGVRTTAVYITHKGRPVAEAYAAGFDPGTPQRTWSVAKSLAATLVGATVERGELTVEESAFLGFRRGEPRKAITIDHLLRMASGRYSDTPGNRTDPLYWGGGSVLETALKWPLVHQPGSVFRYANNDTLAATQAMARASRDHSPEDFLLRVGMTHTVPETDWRAQYVLSSQVWSTARDLAKLGQLYLDGGVLPDGTRILPENWTEYVSAPSGPQPVGRPFGYGAGFWLLNTSQGVPADAFAAFGNRGQYVVIVPSREVVIVRRGEDMVGTRFDIAAFTRDVLAALEE